MPLKRISVVLFLMGVFVFFLIIPQYLTAQENAQYVKQQQIDDLKIKIRTLFANGNYEEVLKECDNLEKLSPNDQTIVFYRQLSRGRMVVKQGDQTPLSESKSGQEIPSTTGNAENIKKTEPGEIPNITPVTALNSTPVVTLPRTTESKSELIVYILGTVLVLIIVGFAAFVILKKVRRPKKTEIPVTKQSAANQESFPSTLSSLGTQLPDTFSQEYGLPTSEDIGNAFSIGEPLAEKKSTKIPSATPESASPFAYQLDSSAIDLTPKENPEISPASPPLSNMPSSPLMDASDITINPPTLFGSNVKHTEEEPLIPPQVHWTQFDHGAGSSTGPSVGEIVQDNKPMSKPPVTGSETSIQFPFDDQSAPSSPPFAEAKEPSQEFSFDSQFNFFDMSDKKPESKPATPVSPQIPTPSKSTPSSIEHMDFGGIELSPSVKTDNEKKQKPIVSQPSEVTHGVSLDEFIFSSDLQTQEPAITNEFQIPHMAGESQISLNIKEQEDKGKVPEELFLDNKTNSFAPGTTDVAESETMAGITEFSKESPVKSHKPAQKEPSAESEKESQEDSRMNFIVEGDTKTLVSEDTRILSPREFEVTKGLNGETTKEILKFASSDEQTKILKGESKQIPESNHTDQAGPSEKTTFLSQTTESEEIGSGIKTRAGDTLFNKHLTKGMESFAANDFKHAIYHLNIAITLRPDDKEVRETLKEARRKRKEAEGYNE